MPEVTLPDVVYDESGTPFRLDSVQEEERCLPGDQAAGDGVGERPRQSHGGIGGGSLEVRTGKAGVHIVVVVVFFVAGLDDDDLDVGGGGSFSGSGVRGTPGVRRGGARTYDHKKYDVDTGGSVVSGSTTLLFDAAVSDDASNLPFGTLPTERMTSAAVEGGICTGGGIWRSLMFESER
ncbi:hypothetical protein ACHAXA_004292 [Cyclostephanos tholiformis]|uniref:Uncharacterized protein n=1 Tax=Cyclostephanos tholiformis TaxID=382380 RepID=A0ABD3SGH9_9STRA